MAVQRRRRLHEVRRLGRLARVVVDEPRAVGQVDGEDLGGLDRREPAHRRRVERRRRSRARSRRRAAHPRRASRRVRFARVSSLSLRSPGGATLPNAACASASGARPPRTPDATRRSDAQGLLAPALAGRALLARAEPAVALRRRPDGDRVLGRSRSRARGAAARASSRTRPIPAARRRSSPTGRAAPTAAPSCSTRRAASTWSSSSSSTRCSAARRSRPARTSGWIATSRSCAAGSRASPRSSDRSG